MVQKWIANNPLTLQERRKLFEGLNLGLSYSELAAFVNRPKTTVMREAKRINNDFTKYDPVKAQKDFEAKQKLIGKKKCK